MNYTNYFCKFSGANIELSRYNDYVDFRATYLVFDSVEYVQHTFACYCNGTKR